jgi:Xaa-Pro aminopeptidase
MTRIEEIARALCEAGLDGWLFYDFRGIDPLAYRILGLPQDGISTRRWFYFIPARGEPVSIVSAVEPHRLEALPGGRIVYRSAAEIEAALGIVLTDRRRIAMDYSPNGAIPYVSRVDGGTIELVRSTGVEVVSAADLIQRFDAQLSTAELSSHRRAAAALREIVGETFAEIARVIRVGGACDELTVQRFVMSRFSARGMTADDPPIVAVNANSANPHYAPAPRRLARIGRGDLVLLDLWAKERGADDIYADFTWVAYAGESVPDEFARIFAIVASARDAAIELIVRRTSTGEPITGREADRAARVVIEAAGYGENFVHRTGHSIGREVHGNGANLDSIETQDHRRLIERTCFSVEPGIYLPGRFGIRSECDMTIENARAEVSAGALQREIAALLPGFG